MTLEDKNKILEELRVAWKKATTDVDRKIIETRAKLIKMSLPSLI